MTGIYVLRDRTPVKVAELSEFEGTQHVARTEVAPGVIVSTVFLGVDHSHGSGPPILFETMVFNDYGDDGTQDRYSTWGDAEAGHERVVAAQRAKVVSP